jgi:hypothetical protein
VAKPQQPELHRSGTTPVDPASAKTNPVTAPPVAKGEAGPIPEANRPGHHPGHEQDKPIDKFVARAQAKVRETQTAPLRQRAARIESEIQDFTEQKAAKADSGTGGGIPLEAVFPALALIDAVRKPPRAWEEVGANRTAWLAGIVLLPGLGAWRYASDLKPRLNAAARALTLTGA